MYQTVNSDSSVGVISSELITCELYRKAIIATLHCIFLVRRQYFMIKLCLG